ncbi:MAG: TetR/AcrR family transcriptional regulator [Actinomycetota bacterium]|jgi:TetR/AcrR family transcriptional regulator
MAPYLGGLEVAASREAVGLEMTRPSGEQRKHLLIEEAIQAFGRDGYNATSLDAIASAVGIRKQTLLYYFPTKEALLEACLAAAGERLSEAITEAIEEKDSAWDRAEAVIHAVFQLAGEWPEFPMFVREAGRLGPDAFQRFAGALEPLRIRAMAFLETGMKDGMIRRQDPALLLFTLYTAVIGSLTEASVLTAVVGEDKGRTALKMREREVVRFVRRALEPGETPDA